MAMTVGSVTVASDGTYSGSGFVLSEMTVLVTDYESALSAMNAPDPPVEARVAALQELAKTATRQGRMLQYIIDNAETDPGGDGII
jgi:hypothetical protein